MIKISNKTSIFILFIVFLFLRLFTSSDYNFIDGDEIKYLEMAKNFPYHSTFNKQIEINHGPFFPYVVHIFTLIFEDYIAAIFISLLSAAITFFVLYKLLMMLTNNFSVTFVTLFFFTLSVEFIISSKAGLKESFVVMLIILSIYYYVKGVKFNNKKSIIAASIFGGLTAITTDHVIFLFPTFILSYVFFNYKQVNFRTLTFPGLKYAILPILVMFLFYASWTGVKAYQYSTNEYYPAGLVGTPVSTEGFGLMELLNPRYFGDYESSLFGGFSFDIKAYSYALGYMFNIVPFTIPRGLNFTTMDHLLLPKHIVYMIVIYLPFAFITLFSLFTMLKNLIKTKNIYNNVNLYMIGVFLIFMFPLTQHRASLRYFYTAFIFLYYFISYGLFILFSQRKKLKLYGKLITVITIGILLLIPYWYYQNNNFILFNKEFIYAQATGDFINSNLGRDDAIMIQPGYIYKLQYLTDRRTVGLTPLSDSLLPLIEYYNIDYVVFGKYFTWTNYFYSKDSVEYIMSHPDEFELIATIKEDYDALNVRLEMGAKMRASDELYIYRVIKSESKLNEQLVFVV